MVQGGLHTSPCIRVVAVAAGLKRHLRGHALDVPVAVLAVKVGMEVEAAASLVLHHIHRSQNSCQ